MLGATVRGHIPACAAGDLKVDSGRVWLTRDFKGALYAYNNTQVHVMGGARFDGSVTLLDSSSLVVDTIVGDVQSIDNSAITVNRVSGGIQPADTTVMFFTPGTDASDYKAIDVARRLEAANKRIAELEHAVSRLELVDDEIRRLRDSKAHSEAEAQQLLEENKRLRAANTEAVRVREEYRKVCDEYSNEIKRLRSASVIHRVIDNGDGGATGGGGGGGASLPTSASFTDLGRRLCSYRDWLVAELRKEPYSSHWLVQGDRFKVFSVDLLDTPWVSTKVMDAHTSRTRDSVTTESGILRDRIGYLFTAGMEFDRMAFVSRFPGGVTIYILSMSARVSAVTDDPFGLNAALGAVRIHGRYVPPKQRKPVSRRERERSRSPRPVARSSTSSSSSSSTRRARSMSPPPPSYTA
jgi:hypothetical protein